MGTITQSLIEAIQSHGPWSVFIGVLVESIIVPIPSPLIIMGAGALLIPPESSTLEALDQIGLKIVLAGSIGSLLGAFVGYGLGFWGGKFFVERLQFYLGFGWSEVQTMEQRLKRYHPGPMIFLLRALPIVPLSLISIAAGIIRSPVPSFAFWTWLGSVPRCWLLGYLGWMTRETYVRLAHRVDQMESIVSGLLLIGLLGLVLWLRHKLRKT